MSLFKPAAGLVALTAAVFLAYSLVAAAAVLILTVPGGAEDSGWPGYLEAVAAILAIGACLPLLKLLCRRLRLRLDFRWPNRREWLLTAKYFFIHFAVLLATSFLIYVLGLSETGEEQIVRQRVLFEGWGFWPTMFLVVAAVPLFEEFLFRGFLFAGLRRAGGFWFSFLVSGVFFALLHLDFAGGWRENLVIFTVIFGLTYFLSRAMEKTSNLAVPVILHGLHNLRVVLVIFWLT